LTNMINTILITEFEGFIDANLARRFLGEDYKVVGVDFIQGDLAVNNHFK